MGGPAMNSLLLARQVRKKPSIPPLAFTAKAILIASLLGAGLIMAPDPAYACSCAENPPPLEALERSAVVFAGRVVSLKTLERLDDTWSSLDPVTVEFEVSRVWKGQDYQTTYLTTARSGASCGFTFVEGEEYLVYSHNATTVSLCSRTRSMAEAEEDLQALGEGSSPETGAVGPTPTVPDTEGRGGGCGLGSSAADMSFVGLMAGVVWLGLRRRRS